MHEPTIVERPQTPYIGMRATVSLDNFHDIADKMPVLMNWAREHGLEPQGAPFFRYHRVDMPHLLDMECCVPVDGDVPADSDVYAAALPGGRFASLTHVGHPDDLVGLTDELIAWGDAADDLTWDVDRTGEDAIWGARLEIFKSEPDVDINKWEVEIAIRLG